MAQAERITFTGSQGHSLSGRLDAPESPRAWALFAHCFTCNKNLAAVRNISRALVAEGVAVFRFDFTGLGESEGDFADTNFSSNVEDLVAAAEHMQATLDAPSILIGHSLGGAAVLHAATHLPEVRAVATIGAPAEPSHVTHLLADSREKIEATGEATVVLAGRAFTIRKQFLDDLDENNMAQCIRALRRPLIICHSPVDQTVGIDNAAAIFQAARHPKSFVSLDRADHLLTNAADSRYVGALIAAWAARYL